MKTYDELINLSRSYDKDRDPKKAKEMMSENNFPFNAKIGMVFTSYFDQLPYMEYALKQYRKIEDMFIVGAYDARHVNPTLKNETGNLPFPEIWFLAHMWVFKHYTWSGFVKRNGWNWSQIYASAILKRFENLEYIFTSNGDCIWENPQGVYEIIDLLGDNDFMSGQSYTRHTDGFNFIHTCSMVFKRDAYFDFIDFAVSEIKESDCAGVSPEALIHRWSLDKKFIHAPIQPTYPNGDHDMYCEAGGESTWKNILGFRNLAAEKNYRCHIGDEPLDRKYIDLRDPRKYWNDHDRNTLHKYYTTGDRRYLSMWHDQDPWLDKEERRKRMRKELKDYKEKPL